MPTPNRHPQRGNVLVLTMFALIPLLGFLGLAVDLGYMFNYKLRAQIAADAAALAAALTPYNPDLLPDPLAPQKIAARDIAKANGFEHGVATTVVDVNTPPLGGDAFKESEPGTYFEADIKQDLPTYFMSAVGVTSFPIHVRAVAKAAEKVGSCLTVGDATFDHPEIDGEGCVLYFSGKFEVDKGKEIKVDSTNISHDIFTDTTKYIPDMPLPDAPAKTFPDFSVSNDPECDDDVECDKGGIISRCYHDLKIKDCTLGPGAYKITGKVEFEQSAKASGEKIIFLLKAGSSITFDGKLDLSSGAPGYGNFILWAENPGEGKAIIQSGYTPGHDFLTRSDKKLIFDHNSGTDADRLLLVGVVTGATNTSGTDAPAISEVTFGGDPMELVDSKSDSTGAVRTYLYQMVNPPTGSASVVVTASGPTKKDVSAPIFAGATNYFNVDPDKPLGPTGTNNVTPDSTITITNINSAPGQIIHAIVGVDGSGAPFSINDADGQTSLGKFNDNSLVSAAISKKQGDASVSMSWSWSNAHSAAAVAVPIIGMVPAGSITFDQNVQQLVKDKPPIVGHIYAPNIPFAMRGSLKLSPGTGAGLAGKPGLAE